MSRFMEKLSRLRWVFVVYFFVLVGIDIVVGWKMAGGWQGSFAGTGLDRWWSTYWAFLLFYLLVSGVLLALGLWLFGRLPQKKNWARVVLLIVAWLTVMDAISTWLFTSGNEGFLPWLASLAPGLDWHKAFLVDRIKDLLGLVFWGYAIYTLQLDREAKREFQAIPPAASGTRPAA